MGSCCLQGCVGWGGAGVEGRGGCRGGRQQMACHTVRAVGWHPEEEEEGGRKIGGGVGGGGNGRWGGGDRDWRGTAPKVPAGIRRDRERDRGEGLWWETGW